jgi:uncharacterized membrane protein YczE
MEIKASGREDEGMRLTRRLVQLYLGLALYGVSMALFLRSELGNMPWDVLHQGIARFVPVSFGTITIATGALVLLGWIPLRQRPGLGTVSNVLVIGIVVDIALRALATPTNLAVRIAFLVGGVVLNAVATAAYIGARFGPGPRDGLMTGVVARFGWPTRRVRTVIEVAVVAVGFALGGTLGIGTVVYALAVGPLVHPLLPLLRVPERAPEAETGGPATREPAEMPA